ncbi:MAG: helix-turn-helix transcriptional regulator [Pseudomonadota bacterium]|nr:helix-turn-helix transcriptional regulator [Pseudomonadota bacterium]
MEILQDQERAMRVRFLSISAMTLLFEVVAVIWINRHDGALSPALAALVMIVGSLAATFLIYVLVIQPRADTRIAQADTGRSPYLVEHEAEKTSVLADLRDDWGLSDAEAEVTLFAVKGFSNKEISELRGSSIATVKKQLSSVYRKSGMENRFQLIAHVNDVALTGTLMDVAHPSPRDA